MKDVIKMNFMLIMLLITEMPFFFLMFYWKLLIVIKLVLLLKLTVLKTHLKLY